MAASATLLSMGHERKVENLRDFMLNLANSRGFSLPETKLFDKKLLDLCCLSHAPDHPTYSAMIFIAITELNKVGGSCKEAISEFVKAKYKNLPYAHTSLLSHHLDKLVEKREILCDYNNYRYTLPGEKKNTAASSDAKRKRDVVTVRKNDQCVVTDVMTRTNKEESVRRLNFGDHKVDLLEGRSLTESKTSSKRKARSGINLGEVRHTEDNVVKACLRDSTVETLIKDRVAEEPNEDKKVALGNSEAEGKIEANGEGCELHEVVIQDERNDVVMEASDKEEENRVELISEQRKAKLPRTSNTMKEACAEGKSEAYKTLWECQTDACNNIVALEKMLKLCRENDQQNKAVSEIDDVSRLPLSMESCKELWKVAYKIQTQLSEMVDSLDKEAVPPYHESLGCEIKGIISKEVSNTTSKEVKQKEEESDLTKKPQVKKTRAKRLRDIEARVLRKSPRMHKH
ncbi:unnamed protein product [Cochlearia groenlandica]